MNFADIEIGKTIKIAGIDWIVLDKQYNTVLCLTKNFIYDRHKFDDKTNNYANSEIRKKLNGEFLKQITDAVGADAIEGCYIDLTSDDGLDDYGDVYDKVGLLTADMYRRYNRIIEKYPVRYWWWLSTAWSTPHRGYSTAVRVVDSNGTLSSYYCNYGSGVRPFCIFKSNIF